MFKMWSFINECQLTADNSFDTNALATLVRKAVAEPESVQNELQPFTGDEVLLHASSNLVIVHVRMSANVHYPPHNHNMPAIIGTYVGSERSYSYCLDDAQLQENGYHDSVPGEVVVLEPNAIHSVANMGDAYSQGLHVYAGDLINQERNIWHPETHEIHAYSDECYFKFCKAYNSSLPFERPEVCHAHEKTG